jgi:arylsulfatase A-like enzyme
MGDDIGIWNIGAYNRGMMAGRTPNLDKLAADGMLFTDYYAEASCTAGRANVITGELPVRAGMTTVGQAGSPIGLPAAAPRSLPYSNPWATPPDSSVRTTSAT